MLINYSNYSNGKIKVLVNLILNITQFVSNYNMVEYIDKKQMFPGDTRFTFTQMLRGCSWILPYLLSILRHEKSFGIIPDLPLYLHLHYLDFIFYKGQINVPYLFHLIQYIMYKNIDTIKAAGFTGFKPISKLWKEHSAIPDERGVYLIINPKCELKKFLTKGVGGFFKQKDPNVSQEELSKNWVENSFVVYIGQAGGNDSAATLRKRLKQYLDFGKGKPVGHYGGRLIWQIQHHPELLIAWKVLKIDDPKIIERELINAFVKYYGKMPFANLTL